MKGHFPDLPYRGSSRERTKLETSPRDMRRRREGTQLHRCIQPTIVVSNQRNRPGIPSHRTRSTL